MNLDKKGTLKLIGVIFVSILFYALVMNFSAVGSVLDKVWGVITPVLLGGAIAFILNMPLRFLECRVFKKLTYSPNRKVWKKIKRPICLTISVLLVLSIVTVLIVIIVPQLIEAIKSFFAELPNYMDSINDWINGMIVRLHIPVEEDYFNINWETISSQVLERLNDSENQQAIADITIEVILEAGTAVFNLIFGFIFAIYILASKERLARSARRIMFSLFKAERARSLLKVASLSNKAFYGFAIGQTLEAITIGVLCLIGMLILRMPYPLLISGIIAVTAFVPVFGPIIGTIIGAFIILIVNPMQAVWFVVFVLILQQIESNVIYPKIMGQSVGLPGLWVLVAVTTFGGLWGIIGIIISIPICSVAYTLFDAWMSKRLIERNIANHHYEVDHSKASEDHGFFSFLKRKKKVEASEEENAEKSEDSEESEQEKEPVETK